MDKITGGVYPTMVTAYDENLQIDYDVMKKLVDWYIDRNVTGLFAVCQSSEMVFLSLQERIELASKIVEFADGRVKVVASGHVSESIEDQITELQEISKTGIDALVMVTNEFAKENESDDVWKDNFNRVIDKINPDVPLGFYECPAPYKRIFTPELMNYVANTNRVLFLKDTCLNVELMKEKIEACKGTSMGLFNAHSATFLDSLKVGAVGYSGVMANFHPEIYAWICENWQKEPEKAELLQAYVGQASLAECQVYSTNAKEFLALDGIPITHATRTGADKRWKPHNTLEIEHFYKLSKYFSEFVK